MKTKLNLFFDLAIRVALESKYCGTKVGCVLTRDNRDVSFGYNGFSAGCDDEKLNQLPRHDRIIMAIHAEENAILNATRKGTSLVGTTAFITHNPCIHCFRRLYDAGVSKVYYIKNEEMERKWIAPNIHLYDFIPLWKNDTKGFSLEELDLKLKDHYHALE